MQRYLLFMFISFFFITEALSQGRYGEQLCKNNNYFCINTKARDTWENLFIKKDAIDLVKRVNRMNIRLRPGTLIAIPKNLDTLNIYDISPFPLFIHPSAEKIIYVSQKDLAWGAYDADGELVWWGPISSGKSRCNGVYGGCKSPTGNFRIHEKQDADCISSTFPMREDGDNGGAEMPYCMYFFLGYALHGSQVVPGYPASHGCIRLFIEDARWLNEAFITVSSEEHPSNGTRVIIGD